MGQPIFRLQELPLQVAQIIRRWLLGWPCQIMLLAFLNCSEPRKHSMNQPHFYPMQPPLVALRDVVFCCQRVFQVKRETCDLSAGKSF